MNVYTVKTMFGFSINSVNVFSFHIHIWFSKYNKLLVFPCNTSWVLYD